MSSHHSRPYNLPHLLPWPALLTRDALRARDALLTSGALLSLGPLLGRPVQSLASALSVHHSSTWISFLWIVKKGVPNNGKRQWSLSEEKKRKPTLMGVTSADVQMIWHGSLVELGCLSNYEVRQQEHHSWSCFELHRYHHLGQFRELWHLFLFVCPLFYFFVAQSLRGTTSSNRSKQSISSKQRISNKQSTSRISITSSRQSMTRKQSTSSKQSISSKDAGKLYGWHVNTRVYRMVVV